MKTNCFFVLRTPLLPFDELVDWSQGLRAPDRLDGSDEALSGALDADRQRLRRRLDAIAQRPEVRDALHVASPGLVTALDHWRRDPESKKGRRAEQALWRYVVRMSARPTPFGLFAGCSVGQIVGPTRLALEPRDDYRRHSRLDMAYLSALAERLGTEPELRQALLFRPNSSLHPVGDRLWYVEGRTVDRRRRYTQVSVVHSEYLETILRAAEQGARLETLARDLVESDPEIDLDDATAFLDELVEAQILVSELAPAVTGTDALASMTDVLEPIDSAEATTRRLVDVRNAIHRLDESGPGAPPALYRAIDEAVDRLPSVEHDAPTLLQVDLYKSASLQLGPDVVARVERGIDLLRKLSRPSPAGELEEFRRAFVERYGEGREIPLLEALDPEIGIGLERQRGAGLVDPWIAELRLGAKQPSRSPGSADGSWGAREALLQRKLDQARDAGADEIQLTPAEIDPLDSDPTPLPRALAAMFTISATSAAAVDAGDYDLLLNGAFGPSGVRMLGRFCQGDAAIRRGVEAHLRAEEATDPDALYAEIVHLPEGRLGNILNRSVLRAWEIPFVGRSGAARESQISPRDLRVSVVGQRVQLRSRRHGRRVEPRMSTAHHFSSRTLGIYRFLCLLQGQGAREGCSWSWAPFERSAFLPRVRSGRLILSRARWRIDVEEQRQLGRHRGAAGYRAVQQWRDRRRLPRFVVLTDGDHRLNIDLDHVLAVEGLVEMFRKNDRDAILTEMLPSPERLCVEGPEGRFVHEIVLPMVRGSDPVRRPSPPAPSSGPRRFAPGSEWLYVKLYAAPSSADTLLRLIVGPIRQRALAAGAADRWFFLRYGDPDWHLRVRFHGRPERLLGEVLPWIEAASAPFLRDGRLRRLELGTYDRELERYGGDEAMPLIERCFEADSEWALAVATALAGDATGDRWRPALVGVHQLFEDFAIVDDSLRLRMVEAMRDAQWARFAGGHDTSRRALGRRLRRERAGLEALVDGRGEPDAPWRAALDRRSEAWASSIADLRRLDEEGRTTQSIREILPSLTHMQLNRMMRYAANEHELVAYDFLAQIYTSKAARRRAAARDSSAT